MHHNMQNNKNIAFNLINMFILKYFTITFVLISR